MTTTAIDQVRKQAAQWAERLMEGDLTAAEREEFQDWLAADESHRREFRVHNSILNLANDLADETRNESLALAKKRASTQRLRRKVWMAGLAASALLTLGLAGWLVYQDQAAAMKLVTQTGMTRDITLPDESVVHLNTRTDLRWVGRAGERRVALLEGEALFEVRHDPAKPFTVVVDNSEIRVLGTRFNVRRRQSTEVVLTVLEGTVAVSQPGSGSAQPAWERKLRANQQIVYNTAGLLRDVHSADGNNAALWREGILEYEEEPLLNVVADLGRYTDRRIVVGDARLAKLRLGGQLDVHGSINHSLRLLEKLTPVTARQSGDTFVLDYRQAAAEEKR